jgi:hypothetical protein
MQFDQMIRNDCCVCIQCISAENKIYLESLLTCCLVESIGVVSL